jgi:hypothetical protein
VVQSSWGGCCALLARSHIARLLRDHVAKAPGGSAYGPRCVRHQPACVQLVCLHGINYSSRLPRRGSKDCEACAVAIAGFTRAGSGNSRGRGAILRAFCSLVSAHQHYHHYAAGQQVRGGGEPARGIAGREQEQEQMRCIWHVCALTVRRTSPERWEGFPAWRRQTRVPQRQTDRRSFTLHALPVPPPLASPSCCALPSLDRSS